MSTKEITIQGLPFNVSQPYSEGHVCTEAEAKALNQTRAENIRNNTASKVKALLEGLAPDESGTITVPAEVMKTAIEAVAEYDAAYVFSLASVGGGRKITDPVEAEARRMAKAAITEKLRAKGQLVKNVDPDALANAIAKLAESPAIQKAAKKAVADRQNLASTDLEELGL
jgi:hypothetical protein